MSANREGPVILYARIPNDPNQPDYVVLPLYNHHPPNHRLRRCLLISSLLFLLLSAAGYLFYPSDPDLTLARLRINHIQVQTSPKPSLNLSLSVSLRVFNRDFFSLDYSCLDVAVGYRGQKLGNVSSDGGHVRARGTSYVNATLDLDGLQVIEDVFYLLEDLARGSIPLDTDSVVEGTVGLFFLNLPIKARIWCEVVVDTNFQTIIRQDCYPK